MMFCGEKQAIASNDAVISVQCDSSHRLHQGVIARDIQPPGKFVRCTILSDDILSEKYSQGTYEHSLSAQIVFRAQSATTNEIQGKFT
jgi:hypothetical protein